MNTRCHADTQEIDLLEDLAISGAVGAAGAAKRVDPGYRSVVDRKVVLHAYDEQVRRHPVADSPHARVERDAQVVRYLSDAWTGVVWSKLDSTSADAVIRRELRRFTELRVPWEWKHHSHDEPADLPERLCAAGFVAEPTETLLVADVADLALDIAPPAGVELRAVRDRDDVAALVAVHHAVFGDRGPELGDSVWSTLQGEPPRVAAVVGFAGSTPIAEARIEFHLGTQFASLWGGATLPAWRGHGVYRALVAYRGALAVSRGFQYLHVDALDASKPILERLGFVALATTTPYLCQPPLS